uniref:C2H2-type zinc finger protein n=1 Tax=Candidatus Sororendozoicomonas aggregata TaxID=3073239 RepID=UPI003B75B51F
MVICKICKQVCVSPSVLNRHMVTHSGVKSFQCELCYKYFSTKESCKVHKKTIHSDAKNFQCPKCTKAFKQNSNLKKHLIVHGIGDYKCHICEKVFSVKPEFQRHMQRLHPDESTNNGPDWGTV